MGGGSGLWVFPDLDDGCIEIVSGVSGESKGRNDRRGDKALREDGDRSGGLDGLLCADICSGDWSCRVGGDGDKSSGTVRLDRRSEGRSGCDMSGCEIESESVVFEI